MRFITFLLFDVLGILLWAGTFLGLGYLFSSELEKTAQYASQLGILLLIGLLCGLLTVYLIRKYQRREQFLRRLRMARITPEELRQKLDAQEKVVIVDLRHPLDFLPEPYTIPGAIRLPMEELEHRHDEIPRDQDVVLYCTCPNEVSSAMTAMRLHQYGVKRVRPPPAATWPGASSDFLSIPNLDRSLRCVRPTPLHERLRLRANAACSSQQFPTATTSSVFL